MARGPRAFLPVLVLAACGQEREPTGMEGAVSAAPAHFTVRGRWGDPARLLWSIEVEGAPVEAETWRRAVERALQAWAATGVVGFTEAAPGEEPDVTFSFRRGRHGACEPFGTSSAVAHSGPVGAPTFVHFDAGRQWSEDGGTGHSLFRTAQHEIGHVLGLGHSAAPDAVMRTDVTDTERLAQADLDGLHSLYGGGADRPGDLAIASGGDEVVAVLRGVAPPRTTSYTLFDTDGDGDDEVLVWRTDRAGHGILMVYHFAAGPRLSLTYGPVYGMSAPDRPVRFARTPDGERLMACVYPERVLLRRFDERGVLQVRAEEDLPGGFLEGLRSGAVGAARSTGDLDGDGREERLVQVRGD